MQQTILRLNIHEPCHEKWHEMTPVEQGAYCKACCKEVTDFTAMSDKDIFNYFEQRKGQQICGRLKNDQLNRPLIDISPDVLLMDIPLWKKFIAALFICFSGFITGCSDKHSPYENIPLPPSSPPVTTITTTVPETIIDEPVAKPKKKNKRKHENSKTIILKYDPKTDWLGIISPSYINEVSSRSILLEKIFGPPQAKQNSPR